MAKELKIDAKLISDNQAELRRLAQSKRSIEKEMRMIKKNQALMSSVGKWKEMTEVKYSIKELMRNSATYGVSLDKLMKMQEYYIYQHPTNSKLKTSNKNADWVKDFLKSGRESQLIDTANKSRPKAWVKMNPKKKRKSPTKTTTKKSSTIPTMNG